MKEFTHTEFKAMTREDISKLVDSNETFIVRNGFSLGDGFTYFEHNQTIEDPNGRLVKLTKLELKFIQYLIDNQGNYASLSDIGQCVWAGKGASIYTIRNIASSIRTKTYYDIMTNKSTKGYILGVYRDNK